MQFLSQLTGAPHGRGYPSFKNPGAHQGLLELDLKRKTDREYLHWGHENVHPPTIYVNYDGREFLAYKYVS